MTLRTAAFLSVLVAAACLVSSCGERASQDPGPSLSAEQCQAIALAERFVVENGYTDAPPSKDPSKIQREVTDQFGTTEAILQMRRGTLLRHAVGLMRETTPNDGRAWAVVFRPDWTRVRDLIPEDVLAAHRSDGRAIYVSLPSEVFIIHMAVDMTKVDILLPSPEQTQRECAATPGPVPAPNAIRQATPRDATRLLSPK